ncbi:MAG: hypothetical protein QXK93_00535 [Candidatus Bathyarchaeia archaeon]|nr:hypothetical protein [Candidatus Bathyarchaeota archaeon]
MGLKSKIKIEERGFFAASIFHVAVGIACFVVLAVVDLRLIHMGLLGIISLATAYGLLRRRFWALWSIFVVTFMATVLAFSMLYYTMGSYILVDVVVTAYLILTWVFTVYVASRRRKLEF